jgi:inner membrane transporter RhtA
VHAARRAVSAVFALPPVVLVVAAILSVQLGASLAATLVRTHAPVTVVALRLAISATVLWLARRPTGRGATAGALRRAVLLGVVIAVMNVSFYGALARLPLGVVVTIEFWGPLAVALVGSRRALDLLWVALAAAGIWILAGGRLAADDAVGVGLAFVAGGGWAGFILLGTRVSHDWPEARGLAISTGVAALILLPLGVLAGGLGEIAADPSLLLLGAGVALFASVVPWSLELVAMGRVPSGTYGILMSLEPAVAAVLGALLLAQALPPEELVAVALVIAASIGSSRGGARGTEETAPSVPGEVEV